MQSSAAPKIVGPTDGKAGSLGSIGVRFMLDGGETDQRFSIVEHPMPPRALGAPLHKHSREDEYTFVLEGRMGALLGDHEVYAEAGDFIVKPRDQWHTFWNAGDEPCRLLEIISPGGFEGYFAEMAEAPPAGPPDFDVLAERAARYGLEMDFESVPRLCEKYGLRLGD